MTDDRIALEALIEKAPDADFLREMISFAAERLMALEVDGTPLSEPVSLPAADFRDVPEPSGPAIIFSPIRQPGAAL